MTTDAYTYDAGGIPVQSPVPLSLADLAKIAETAKDCGAHRVVADVDGEGYIVCSYFRKSPPFERIRRITGYLVGTLERFNDAKRAEEHDRVKHLSKETK